MKESSIVIISAPEDSLSNLTATMLQAQGVHVLHVSPDTLGSLSTNLHNDSFKVDGHTVCGVFFRCSPNAFFSTGFKADDQNFCDAEIRATWLAALHLEAILAVNQYDAAAWFEGLGWPVWRRKLIQTGIPVSTFTFGDVPFESPYMWYPYTSHTVRAAPGFITQRVLGSALTQATPEQSSLIVGNKVLAGKKTNSVLSAKKLLRDAGIRIAEIVTDTNEKIITVNTLPTISDAHLEELASRQIARMYYAHLHSR